MTPPEDIGLHASKGTIRVLQLYPRDMNIYGDWGNALVLRQRLLWHGYTPELLEYNVGDDFPEDVDLIVGGGGQDSGQIVIQDDLQARGEQLREHGRGRHAHAGYLRALPAFRQVLQDQAPARLSPGSASWTSKPSAPTNASSETSPCTSSEFGEILGYENHSGQTTLGPGVEPLGTVSKGAGNNSKDNHEGARHRNVVASYLHGSLLPKNPAIADFLIRTAVERKYGAFVPGTPDDDYARLAREHAARRPR